MATQTDRAWVILYNTIGVQLAIFDSWETLEIKHTLNSYSTLVLTLNGDDPRTALFGLDFIITVQRRVGDYQYMEYIGLHRTDEHAFTNDQHKFYISHSVGLLHLLARRGIMYPKLRSFTLKQAPGETVMWELVNENAGPGASSLLRYNPNGVMPGLTLAPDTARGPVWTGETGNKNLLALLGEIAPLTSVDFDVALVSTLGVAIGGGVGRNTPLIFEFKTYYPQRGVDRSATMRFDPTLGNMQNVNYSLSRLSEVTLVIVLGPGTEDTRYILTQTAPTVNDSPWNLIETTTDGSSISAVAPSDTGIDNTGTYESMVRAGQTALLSNRPQQAFTFDVLQTETLRYGRDYRVGDIITASLATATTSGGISQKQKIVGASIKIEKSTTAIKLDFAALVVLVVVA